MSDSGPHDPLVFLLRVGVYFVRPSTTVEANSMTHRNVTEVVYIKFGKHGVKHGDVFLRLIKNCCQNVRQTVYSRLIRF